jgi:hypothetical protein
MIENNIFGLRQGSYQFRKSADRVLGKIQFASLLGFLPALFFGKYWWAISLPFIVLVSGYLKNLVWYQKEFITETGEKKKGINYEAAKQAREEEYNKYK